MLDVRLPEEVLERLPSTKDEMVRYLLPFADEAISEYEKSLAHRVKGVLGGALARHERAMLRDFILDRLMNRVLREETYPVLPAISA